MAASIAIRKATAQDAESIAECLRQAFEPFRAQYTPDAFSDTVLSQEAVRQRLLQMIVYAAVAAEGEIVGTVASSRDGLEGHLRGMAVRPPWQGRSVAMLLLQAAERDLLAAGCDRVTLDSTIPLERAASFYRRNGYILSGKINDFFGMPLLQYWKPLARHSGLD